MTFKRAVYNVPAGAVYPGGEMQDRNWYRLSAYAAGGLTLLGMVIHLINVGAFGLLLSLPGPETDFRRLCHVDGGVRIYRQARNVRGYAKLPFYYSRTFVPPTIAEITSGKVSDSPVTGGCFPCFHPLVRDGYDFFETYYVQADQRLRWGRDYDVEKTGLYRYQLIARKGHEEMCKPYDRLARKAEAATAADPMLAYSEPELVLFNRQAREYAASLEGKCIFAQRIEAFSARYREQFRKDLLAQYDSWLGHGTMFRFHHSVRERDGTVLAESIAYQYVPSSGSSSSKVLQCGGYLPKITELLPPARREGEMSIKVDDAVPASRP